MSLSLILGCLWVLVATAVAILPLRLQYGPGLALLATAPVLIGVIWWEQGWIWGVLVTLVFLSIFRKPVAYLLRRLRNRGEKLREDYE
ncbi:DUF2484 family protein [Pseudooceanicola sp. LIPI14-2-Ac024]|uniref:DUF2484 family protein n=1 Tax=Pseudooceanicola sp. LIPI14-2-Ac024 TaxID=3344875 RepID=UPI0035D0EABF